jgi:uncharacterized membrane protein
MGGAFRTIHVVLWIGQALLAAVFLLVGFTHAIAPIAAAIARAPWVASLPVPLVRFIGVTELAGAIGILLPAASRILPGLTTLAAVGLSTVMALAIPFHVARGETKEIGVNLVLGALAAFVAWGRARRAPIAPRR